MNLYEFLDRPIIVRPPAEHEQFPGSNVCPECGQIIDESEGPTFTPTDRVENDEFRKALLEDYPQRFPTFGYVCSRHEYDVLTPKLVSNGRATGFLDGWVGVPVRFHDGATRHIPVPEVEVEEVVDA
ncbi:MAG: hypothetical protein ABEJ58_09840 [Halodesulfurarchaeum sp.]